MADTDTILSVVKEIEDKYDSVFIVGHNPGLTEFVNLMGDKTIENIPTLGIVALKCETKKWQNCGYHGAKTEFFIYPKMFKD